PAPMNATLAATRLLSPAPMNEPSTFEAMVFVLSPATMLAAAPGCRRSACVLFARMVTGILSVLPRKFVPSTVPLLPESPQPPAPPEEVFQPSVTLYGPLPETD